MKTLTGFTAAQFEEILNSLPSLKQRFKDGVNASNALLIYLMKIRTGCSNEKLKDHFKLSLVTIKRRLDAARECMLTDFVPLYLRNRSREEMALHNTDISARLYAQGDPQVITQIWDGTYVYIDKSSNIGFQKKTYSGQKKRNFVRMMMCVSPDGYIEKVYGPFEATTNDAQILAGILEHHSEDLNFEAGDVIVLDRGFRDIVPELKRRGYNVRIPEFINKEIGVLTTEQANLSRFCTKVRYVVETKNGHIKQFFQIFNDVWCYYGLLHLEADFRICAALLNKFSKPVISDKGMEAAISARMLDQFDKRNILSEVTRKNNFQRQVSKFTLCEDSYLKSLPKLTMEQLTVLACGTYQLRLAPAYYHEKMKTGEFAVLICPADVFQRFFGAAYSRAISPKLLLTEFHSRFASQTKHHTYLLLDTDETVQGLSAILGYCCSCKNGRRTVGACSHVICLVWYLCLGQHGAIKIPAVIMDNYFDDHNEVQRDDDDDQQ